MVPFEGTTCVASVCTFKVLFQTFFSDSVCCLEPSGPVGSPMANWSRRREHTSGSRTRCEVNKLWWFRFTNQKTSPWFFCNTCNIYESWELDIVVRIEHVLRASVEFALYGQMISLPLVAWWCVDRNMPAFNKPCNKGFLSWNCSLFMLGVWFPLFVDF